MSIHSEQVILAWTSFQDTDIFIEKNPAFSPGWRFRAEVGNLTVMMYQDLERTPKYSVYAVVFASNCESCMDMAHNGPMDPVLGAEYDFCDDSWMCDHGSQYAKTILTDDIVNLVSWIIQIGREDLFATQ